MAGYQMQGGAGMGMTQAQLAQMAGGQLSKANSGQMQQAMPAATAPAGETVWLLWGCLLCLLHVPCVGAAPASL
jgi:hypothetical protein